MHTRDELAEDSQRLARAEVHRRVAKGAPRPADGRQFARIVGLVGLGLHAPERPGVPDNAVLVRDEVNEAPARGVVGRRIDHQSLSCAGDPCHDGGRRAFAGIGAW